jgi:hypothetical protein
MTGQQLDMISKRVQRARALSGSANRNESRAGRAEMARLRARYPDYFHQGYFQPRYIDDHQIAEPDVDEDLLMGYLADFNPTWLEWIANAVERADGKFQVFCDRPLDIFVDRHPTMGFMPPTLNAAGLVARDILLNRQAELDERARDPELDALDAMARYADHGFEGPGWSPSAVMKIHYLIMLTREIRDGPAARINAKKHAIKWVEEGRARWKAGFVANPFGDPVLRK